MHFQKLQDKHKLCIFNIILLAYDYLFEQHRSSHEEYPVNKNLLNKEAHQVEETLPIKGHGMIIVYHLGQSSQDSENLSKCQIARGKSPPESLGALYMDSGNESCLIKHLLVVWQHNTNDSDNSLHSESADIVERILCIIKDPLG